MEAKKIISALLGIMEAATWNLNRTGAKQLTVITDAAERFVAEENEEVIEEEDNNNE